MKFRHTFRARTLHLAFAAASISAAALVACGGGGGGGTTTGPDASMRMALTDAPSCGYDHVWVTVNDVGVNKSGTAGDGDAGWVDIAVNPAKRIDLLALNNGVLEELGQAPLQSGSYNQVRLVLASNDGATGSVIPNAIQPTGGAVTALTTPSGQQSGLKLQAHFDVAAGQMADLVLDFDACRSIVSAGASGKYLLKPVMSVVPRTGAAITGYVGTSLPLAATTVSAQVSGKTVRATTPDASGMFSIPFLAQGTYDVVVTADGHATGVVSSVPVGTSTVALNGTATAIVTPASAIADVTGSVVAGAGTSGSASVTPVTDASVTASQSLTGGPTVLVASQAVDATAATYHLRLPADAPVKAPWTQGAPLAFTADAAAAGKYTIQAQAPDRAVQTTAVGVSSGAGAVVNFSY